MMYYYDYNYHSLVLSQYYALPMYSYKYKPSSTMIVAIVLYSYYVSRFTISTISTTITITTFTISYDYKCYNITSLLLSSYFITTSSTSTSTIIVSIIQYTIASTHRQPYIVLLYCVVRVVCVFRYITLFFASLVSIRFYLLLVEKKNLFKE